MTGRLKSLVRRGRGAQGVTANSPAARTGAGGWRDSTRQLARSHGVFPYDVEGFVEVSEAVRRGHSVVLRRERCEVAEGMTIFDDGKPEDVSVTVAKFDVRTARFVISDPHGPVSSIELTPKRLQRYLDAPSRAAGVALG